MTFRYEDLKSDDLLGILDQPLGIIPNEIARRSHKDTKHSKKNSIDSKSPDLLSLYDYVINLNQNMSVLEGYCGKEFDKTKVTIERLTQAHGITFERKIEPKDYASYLLDSFSLKKNGDIYFLNKDKVRTNLGNNSHPIEKNDIFVRDYPHIVTSLQDVIDKPNNFNEINEITNKEKFKDSSLKKINFTKFLDRFNLANKFDSCVKSKNYEEFLLTNISQYLKTNYEEKTFHSHIGIIRNHPDQTIFLFLNCYDTTEIQELEDANAALDHFVPDALEYFTDMRNLICKGEQLCKNRDKQPYCRITKILARPIQSKKICVLYFVSFTNSIFFDEREKNLPPGMLRNYLNKSIFKKGWEIYWPKKNRVRSWKIFPTEGFNPMKIDTGKSNILKSISMGLGGFIAINNHKVVYGSKDGNIQKERLENSQVDNFLFSIQQITHNSSVRCYPYDKGNSVVLSIGKLFSTDYEAKLLNRTMKEADIVPRTNFISSLVGVSFNGGFDKLDQKNPSNSVNPDRSHYPKQTQRLKPSYTTSKSFPFLKSKQFLLILTVVAASILILSVLLPSVFEESTIAQESPISPTLKDYQKELGELLKNGERKTVYEKINQACKDFPDLDSCTILNTSEKIDAFLDFEILVKPSKIFSSINTTLESSLIENGLNYSWSINPVGIESSNKKISSDAKTVYKFDSTGQYKISLDLSSDLISSNIKTKVVEIYPVNGIEIVGPSRAYISDDVLFEILLENLNFKKINVDFGDNSKTFISDLKLSHVYSESGSYFVNVEIFFDNQETLSATHEILITSDDDPLLPMSPTGLEASIVSSDQIKLTWNMESDIVVDNFILEHKFEDNEYVRIANTSNTFYTHLEQIDGLHTYRVYAINSSGSSDSSEETSAFLLSVCVPGNITIPHYPISNEIKSKPISQLLHKAEEQIKIRNYVSAIIHYEAILAKDCRNTLALIGAGNALIKTGHLTDAENYHLAALVLDSENANAITGLGNVYLARGDLDKARLYYEQSLDMDETPFAYIGLGNVSMFEEQYHMALNFFTRAISLFDNDNLFDAYNGRGNTYYKMEQYENAIFEYERTRDIPNQRNNTDAILGIGISTIILSSEHNSIYDYDEGKKIITQALDLNSDLINDVTRSANDFFDSAGESQIKKAKSLYDVIIDLGDYESAKKAKCNNLIIEAELLNDKNFISPVRTGNTSELFNEIKSKYIESDNLCNNNPIVWYKLGQLMNTAGTIDNGAENYDEAIKNYEDAKFYFEKVIELGPSEDAEKQKNSAIFGFLLAYSNKGYDALENKDYDEAELMFFTALKDSDNFHDAKMGLKFVYYGKGNELLELNKCSDAIHEFEKILKFFENDEGALEVILLAQKKINTGMCQ